MHAAHTYPNLRCVPLKFNTRFVSHHKPLDFEKLLLTIGFANPFLPSLQTLQSIQLSLSVETGPYRPRLLLPLIFGLDSIRGKNIIESINISLDIFVNIEDSECGDDWGALDKVFTQSPSGWEMLKLFSFHIGVFGEEDEVRELKYVDALWRLPVTYLRGLSRCDNFPFDFQVRAIGLN